MKSHNYSWERLEVNQILKGGGGSFVGVLLLLSCFFIFYFPANWVRGTLFYKVREDAFSGSKTYQLDVGSINN